MDDKWQKIKELYEAALLRPPDERAVFLNESCGGDEELRREVESLLSFSSDAGDFLEKPAIGEVAEIIVSENKTPATGKNFGHYEIIEKIGAGGMGEVYLARDKKLDRKVAVKILNEKFARHESNLKRFNREAKAASALNHPNILVIHEIGAEGEDAHYIISELVKGETLREVLRQSPLKLSEILDIAIQVAGALAAAHEARLIHRDIKPENVMIRPDGLVKVLDFGLAKLVEQKNQSVLGLENSTAAQNQTAKGLILGTVNYMSPEQAKGERVDERTDIFSLGVLVYEMIAGRTPFAGDSLSETFANLINREPPPLARFSPTAPDEVQRIVSKMLRKNRDERYRTMRNVLTDLKDLQENLTLDEKLEKSRAPKSENATSILRATTGGANLQTAETQSGFSRQIKNHKRGFFAAVAVLLVVAFGFGWWFYASRLASTDGESIKSIAVLPLRSLDAGENYLGLGIADAVIRRISQTGELTVRPTSAVRRYLNEDTDALAAARQLSADAVLEGSVQSAGDRLRVSVNLLRTGDGASLWADNFDMRMTDIFTIQDTVARQVASRLRLRLDSSQQARLMKRATSNPVAYEFYMKGVYNFDQRGWGENAKPQMEATIELFKKAIEAEPNFALARAQLAYAYAWMATVIEPTEPAWAERAKEEINRAQTLDPQLAETRLARYLLLASRYENYQNEAAIRELLSAQQINPNVGHAELGFLYYHIGLEDLTARELQRALEIDPTSDFARSQSFNQYLMNGRYDEALAAHQKLYPNDPISARYFLGKGRLEEAQRAIEELLAREPDNFDLPRQQALLFALRGDFRLAERMIPAILSKHPPYDLQYHHAAYDIACIYALGGKSEEAVKWLRETAATGFRCYPLFERDAYLNRIRQTPELVQFMAEMRAQFENYRREFAQ